MSDPHAALTPGAEAALRTVLALLAEERTSVSSVTDERAWRVHVEDSLTGLEVPALRGPKRVADVGAGAGFPGLVLAAALPDSRIDLIESVARKCAFMERAIEASGLANARVINLRSEEWAERNSDGREAYEAVTARAVARLSTLAELASPLLGENGHLVAWKGKRDPEEEAELHRASDPLAMKLTDTIHVGPRAGSDHRHLYVLQKTSRTPDDLPRRPGMAKKRPKG